MAETIVVTEEMVEEESNRLRDIAQKTFYVGLGAVDMAREEITQFVEKTQERTNEMIDRFIERGETVQKDGRKEIEKRRKEVDKRTSKVQAELDTRIEKVLHRLNVPTKTDIEELNKKLNNLIRKVNALAKEAKESAK